ncbi:MAG: hypothetical protein EAZ92_02165 [Candidatus Kapaibacterium sp.]|nr:MAG: hypothetical protein EAZ92_02165 [Candidatus Kapabacteria bacterium]
MAHFIMHVACLCASLLLLVAQALLPLSAQAQASEQANTRLSPWSVSLFGGPSQLFHTSRMDILLDKPECCQYERGTALGLWAGLGADYALLPQTLSLSARAMFAMRPLVLSETVSERSDGRQFLRFNPALPDHEPLQRRYTYHADIPFLAADVGVKIQPFSTVPVYLRLSGEIALPIGNTRSARQTSQLPEALRFPGGLSEVTTIRENSVPLRQFIVAALGGIGGEIALERRLFLGVEVNYRYGLGGIRSDAQDWRMDALQAALGLRWNFADDVPQAPQLPQEQNQQPPSEDAPALVSARFPLMVKALSGNPLELQETVVTQTFPLLPYIFFDSASVVVRNRYNPRIAVPASFNEVNLPKETMQIYYHILHIVGRRMKANPNAILTITGTTDGKEWASTDQRQILALQRARSVASFLTGFWGIPQSRIKLTTRDTPSLPSSSRYAEGDEENRRVELSASVPEILTPVVHAQFLEFTPMQDKQLVSVKLLNPDEAESYEGRLEATPKPSSRSSAAAAAAPPTMMTTDTLALTKGIGAPPERLPFLLGRKFAAKLLQYGSNLDEVRCKLEIQQHNGAVMRGETVLPVNISKNQYEVSRLNLIVFDFDSDDMRATNEVMLRRFTQESIKPTSQVRITGSTDRLGEVRYNQELSESRAKAVQEVMKRVNPRIQFPQVRGTGASTLPFDNDTPEGRYYCRTVRIDVQTPRK